MTVSEAHTYLEALQRGLTRIRYPQEIIEANGVAILALEKQIPEKPKTHKVDVEKIKIGNRLWCIGTTVYYCPNCKDFISRAYKFCHKCGQALDWSDTE